MNLTYQQEQELLFWKDLYNRSCPTAFNYIRHGDLLGKTAYFNPELFNESGLGLDYGCALVSMFEFSDLKVDACDPLLEEFDKIYKYRRSHIKYYENVDDSEPNIYDFVVCVNVIDHTPDPRTVIDDILKVLKPGGRLYFEVNFDPEVFAPHHTLWNMDMVRKYLLPEEFELVREATHVNPNWDQQTLYEAVYIKK